MVNKKLMTSLFNVKFILENGDWEFYDRDLNRLSNPLPQYKYITDKVDHPKRSAGVDFPDLIWAGPDINHLLVYTFDWSVDGTTPWNLNKDTVEKDIVLKPCNFVEHKWKIEFNLVATGNLRIDNACIKEALPATITGISNGSIVTSAAANNYASDYTKNQFKYSTTGSDLHCVLRNATGNACRWINEDGSNFYFGTTPVKKDLKLHMDWSFKTWNITFDYNTGVNRYYNDFRSGYNYTISGLPARAYNANAIYSVPIEDNFTINTSPSYSTLAAWLTRTSTFYHAGLNHNSQGSCTVKISNWYNEMGRTSVFDRANFKFKGPKTIYARWVNSQSVEYFRTASGPNYQSWDEVTDAWYTTSGTYTTPSFCPDLYCEVIGAGGNSNSQTGCRATDWDRFEVSIVTPGGNASKSALTHYTAVTDSSKLAFSWLALGCESSYNRSYIKRGSWEVNSYRGAQGYAVNNGSTSTNAGRNLCNVGDADDESKPITDGKRSVLGFFINKLSKGGQVVYTKDVNNYSNRKNTGTKTLYLFKGYADPNDWTRKHKTIWCYLNVYFYTDPGAALVHYEYCFGKLVYAYYDSNWGNSNSGGYDWGYGIGSEQLVRYYTQGGVFGNRNYYGKGGQAIFATSKSSKSGARDKVNCCYGSGGYIRFYWPAQ